MAKNCLFFIDMDNLLIIVSIGLFLIALLSYSFYFGYSNDPNVILMQQVSYISSLCIKENQNHAYPELIGNYLGRFTKIELINIGGYEGVLPYLSLVITIKINKYINYSIEINKKVRLYISEPVDGLLFKDIYTIKGVPSCYAPFFYNKDIHNILIKINFDMLTIRETEMVVIINRMITDPENICSILSILASFLISYENFDKLLGLNS